MESEELILHLVQSEGGHTSRYRLTINKTTGMTMIRSFRATTEGGRGWKTRIECDLSALVYALNNHNALSFISDLRWLKIPTTEGPEEDGRSTGLEGTPVAIPSEWVDKIWEFIATFRNSPNIYRSDLTLSHPELQDVLQNAIRRLWSK